MSRLTSVSSGEEKHKKRSFFHGMHTSAQPRASNGSNKNIICRKECEKMDENNNKSRVNYGRRAGIFGVIGNCVLFLIKFIMGTASNSIAVIADSFNNLMDCAGACTAGRNTSAASLSH